MGVKWYKSLKNKGMLMFGLKFALNICLLFGYMLLSSGCVATAIMGGATATTAAFDERSLGDQFDDVSIATKVDARLIAEKDMPSRWVSVEVIEGMVILTGYLPTQQHIDRTLFIVRGVQGVKNIRNELLIGEPSTSSLFSDSWITAQVKRKFLNDKVVSGMSIHVETVNGKVYLQGILASDIQRYQAVSLTKSVQGVTAVVDFLHVRGQ